ncbi:MAG: cache domain-containing sensor histidine kinase [Bacteroidota bacterium]
MLLTNRIRRLSLKNKILIFVALILFLAISTVGVYAYFLAADQVAEKVIETQLGLVRQVSNNFDYILNDLGNTSSLIIFDPNLQNELKGTAFKRNILSYSDLRDYLDRILASKSYISMISIYGYNGLVYSTGSGYTSNRVVPFADFKANPIYQKALNLNGGIGVEYFRNQPPVVVDNRRRRILMYRVIKDINQYRNLGIMLLWIDEEKIRSIYRTNVPNEGSTFIVDQNGMIVSHTNPARLQETVRDEPYYQMLQNQTGSAILRINNQKMLFTFSTSQETGWKVLTLTPAAILTQKISWLAFIIVTMGSICYLLLFYLSFFITSMITNPLRQLSDSIKKVQAGDFSQQVSFTNEDEIGDLGRGYNGMIASIKDLIDRVYKLQIREREAELNALQAQINPHFLYNTLDTIFWKAERNRVPEISEMVLALSRIFRLSLNRGNELATVAQEQELVQEYLKLQQMRFKKKLTYNIDFDPDLLVNKMPKLIIQPFVENAIIHGIEGLENGGHLQINGRLQQERMIFTITDNGIGMDEQKIDEILARNAGHQEHPVMVSGGYAIKNVLERLELYYSSNHELKFISTPGEGTTVTIDIPATLKE